MKALKSLILTAVMTVITVSAYCTEQVPLTAAEKRAAMLTSQYYTNWIGASFFTIATVEKEFDVTPAQILNLTFFYDFDDCFVGMASNENGVVVQMTLRLFADKATEFIQKAVDNGYEYIVKGEDINARSNTGKILPDVYATDVMQYRIKTSNGNVYMEVANSGKYANGYEIAIYRAK